MRIYVSGATTTVKRLAATRHGKYLGHLVTPQNGNDLRSVLRTGLPWACDNSAYSNPNETKFWNLTIDAWEWMRASPPEWIAVPDKVGDHTTTLRMFHDWYDYWVYELGGIYFPLAFVLQNGATIDSVPWDLIQAVFIGGDDQFKLYDCHDLIDEAKQRKKLSHVGRVNSLGRIKYALDIGADSIDGSGFSMFPDTKIPRALREIEKLTRMPAMF